MELFGWGMLDCDMLECICDEKLLKFVTDVLMVKDFLIFKKYIKCKFTNLINIINFNKII